MEEWQRKTSREMVGGCCVCLDETGWPDNKLVYCDGAGCNVAVHQACYGIISVPEGSWFCKRCESQERQVRLKCELCPSKEGALKKTDNSGWAHIVCALYIPEVKFGNNTTMEPIRIAEVPCERFQKSCYICEDRGDSMNAKNKGACISCHYPSCRRSFHVTCAQGSRLLCEQETGTERLDYFGYCESHISQQGSRTFSQSPAELAERASVTTSSSSTPNGHSDGKGEQRGGATLPTDISKAKKDKLRDNPKGRSRSVAHRNRGQHHRSKSMTKSYYPAEGTGGSGSGTGENLEQHKKRMTMSAIIAGEASLPNYPDASSKPSKDKSKLTNPKKRHFPSSKQGAAPKKFGKYEEQDGSPAVSPSSHHSYEDSQVSQEAMGSPGASCSPNQSETEVKAESEDSDYKNAVANSESLKGLLNKSWEGDTHTLLNSVSSYGDIASLLSLVYVIKSDNELMKSRLEELTKKRDYLKSVNDGLKLALSAKDASELPPPNEKIAQGPPETSIEPLKLRLSPDDVLKVEKVVNKIIMSSDQT